ncbi:MAG: TonB-dependent receptor [Nitrospiria bacterium]
MRKNEMQSQSIIFQLLILIALTFLTPIPAIASDDPAVLEPMTVTGKKEKPKTDKLAPSIVVEAEEVEHYNAPTIEDVIKYQPSLIVRRRFIGDPNGTLGIRGSNMFQTTRSMVFADGLPLHNLLQSRFSGAPRWSLAAPSEVDSVEVIYGPFNAEYSGNAMGGVVKIKTKMPEKEEYYIKGSTFIQDFDFFNTKETVQGNREFFSYGNKVGDLSVYFFYDRLENEGHPMTFRFDTGFAIPTTEPVVTGAVKARDERSRDAIFFADTGVEEVNTDLLKLKMGYDVTPDLLSVVTLAYEKRERSTVPNNYLRDASGNIVWGDLSGATKDAVFNGEAFDVRADRFGVSDSERKTFLAGLHFEGNLSGNWDTESTLSHFDVLKDESISSTRSPADPNNDNSGRITDFGDTGWMTYDLKFVNRKFLGREDLFFVSGYHYDRYELEIRQFNTNDFRAGTKDSPRNASGGKTQTHAIFGQLAWSFLPDWDVIAGLRWEDWRSEDGFLNKFTGGDPSQPDRNESRFSPKFSAGYEPGPWKFRYSFAKAYRFPIVEELFKNVDAFNSAGVPNPGLDPENGTHHNFLTQYDLSNGYVRVNIFRDDVKDVIFNQTNLVGGSTISTLLPIDEVNTTGIEFVADQRAVMASNLDVKFNVTWMEAEIGEHRADPTLVGNEFPRLPEWRANIFTTYHVSNVWDISVGGRYQSDNFGRLDNTDTEDKTMGAHDEYLFFNFKTVYRLGFVEDGKISFGIDNITDETAFVHHPWPQRTYFVEADFAF